MPKLQSSHRIAIALVVFAMVLGARAFAATVTPISPAPEGSIGIPLNTSATAQTKAGKLLVLGISTVNNGLNLGKASGTSSICWNGDCRTSWDDVARVSGFLRLVPSTSPDVGLVSIQGTGGASDPAGAVNVTAGTPSTGFPTFAIQALAESNTGANLTAKSYGVLGQAAVNRPEHSAIYATTKGVGFDYSQNAWAGYFYGNLGIGGVAEDGGFDLVIGGGSAQNNGVAQLCLGGDCRNVWPTASGSGVWTLASVGGRNYLRPNSTIASLRVGGGGPTAPFKVDVSSVAGVPTDASLTVTGPSKFERYVVGTPSNLSVTQTCGDGVCNNSENDIFSSPNYCPIDCDVTAPGDSYMDDSIPVSPCQRGVLCPQVPPYLYISVYTPNELDVTGFRVIVRSDRFPTGPLDTSGGFHNDVAALPNKTTNYFPSCQMEGVEYYVGIYTIDRGGNFAPGTLGLPACLDRPLN